MKRYRILIPFLNREVIMKHYHFSAHLDLRYYYHFVSVCFSIYFHTCSFLESFCSQSESIISLAAMFYVQMKWKHYKCWGPSKKQFCQVYFQFVEWLVPYVILFKAIGFFCCWMRIQYCLPYWIIKSFNNSMGNWKDNFS
jgi:hypothetical protein